MPEIAGDSKSRPPLVLLGAGLALIVAATVLLWAHYGTTVFFETIRQGFVACFG